MTKRVALATAILCVAGYVFVYASARAGPPIRSDGYSYYVYLPSWFIYHDSTLSSVARDCCGGEFPAFTAIIRWPKTRRWVNAHPIGVAIMQSPFFLVAHGLTKWSNLSPDGFTFYYQHAAGISGVFWAVAGVYILSVTLRRHFRDGVAAMALAALPLGTGLYHYATYDSSYSHVYSFCLLAAFIELSERWHLASKPSRATAVVLGLIAGLIVLTRHTNVIFLSIFPLYGVTNRTTLGAAVQRLSSNGREIATIAAVAAIVLLPQLAIYYQATGRVLVSSYGDLSFNFLSPHLWDVLFSVQKGLFFWSPLLLAAVAGFVLNARKTRPFALGTAVVLIADTYLIASWWDWQFGASYGHRGFVDTLPLLAIGLAGFFEWSAARLTRTVVVGALATAAVCLSAFQMLQYWNGVMPMSDLTWDQYRAVFLRFR
jgi:hypothetical protein